MIQHSRSSHAIPGRVRSAVRSASLLIMASSIAWAAPAVSQAPPPAWEGQVAAALGRTGTEMPGGVYRVSLPRTDLNVQLDGIPLKTGFAFGGWLAFAPHGAGQVMVMGDLVLTEDEVNPVMKRLLDGGLEVTALHNHLLRSNPHTMYMHVGGMGEAATVARTLHDALALTRLPAAQPAAAVMTPPPVLAIDVAGVEAAMGRKGKNNGGVLGFSIPRATPPRVGGMAVPDAMGSAIAINFQPTHDGRAAITGDFVLTQDEVLPVMRSLRASGIDVTALHNHMLDDEPRLFFMHFWAEDDAVKLARGLAGALGHVKLAPPKP